MDFQAEVINMDVLDLANQISKSIESGNEVSARTFLNFKQKVSEIVNDELRAEITKRVEVIENALFNNRGNVTNDDLDHAMDSLEKITHRINKIKIEESNRAHTDQLRKNSELRDEQYRADYYAKNNEEFLRGLTTRLGERVYSDEVIASMSYAEMEDLVSSIKTNLNQDKKNDGLDSLKDKIDNLGDDNLSPDYDLDNLDASLINDDFENLKKIFEDLFIKSKRYSDFNDKQKQVFNEAKSRIFVMIQERIRLYRQLIIKIELEIQTLEKENSFNARLKKSQYDYLLNELNIFIENYDLLISQIITINVTIGGPGKKPVDPVEPGKGPVDPVEPGKKPVDPVEPGKGPVDPVEPGKNPVDPVEPGKGPVDPVEPGKKPVDPVEPGKKPVDPVEPGKGPVDPVEPGKNPVDPEPKPTIYKPSIEMILHKIAGKEDFTERQSSRYMASKVKIFNKVPKDELGRTYRLLSFPRRMLSIIPRAFMKIRGKFISKDTRELMQGVEERINNLTDEEVLVILTEYKGNLAHGIKLPQGINQLMVPRIQRYISSRVLEINLKIADLLQKLALYKQAIELLDSKTPTTPEEVAEKEATTNKVYKEAADCIGQLKELEVEGNNLQNGDGFHAFQEEVKALGTKMNYKGGSFAKARNYDAELSGKIAALSDIIKNDKDPKMVVDAFFERQQIYIDNTETKRSALNLFSEVSSGKLEYRPFVETLNYGDNPLIGDLISTILMVTTIANVVYNLTKSVALQAEIAKANQTIRQNNRNMTGYNDLSQDISTSGKTIRSGVEGYTNERVLSVEDMAERHYNSLYNHHTYGASYAADDLAHHTALSKLQTSNMQQIGDITSKLRSGSINEAQAIESLSRLSSGTANGTVKFIQDADKFFPGYASANPQFDMTAVVEPLAHLAQNPTATTDLFSKVSEWFTMSSALPPLQTIPEISALVGNISTMPAIAALAAAGAKVSHDQVKADNEGKPYQWDKDGKFEELKRRIMNGENLYKQSEVEEFTRSM